MKTYNFEEFVKLPVGTLFYMEWNMRVKSFFIKHDSIIDDEYKDFYFTELITHKDIKQRYGSPDFDEEFEVLGKEDLLYYKNIIDNALSLTKEVIE